MTSAAASTQEHRVSELLHTGAPASAGRWGPWIATAFRAVLGAVMLTAGALKIGDLEQSAVAVKAYRIMPSDVAQIVGYALPPLEVVLGILLILGLFTRAAATVTAALLIVFIAGIISVWVRGISIECGCFNAGGSLDSPINPFEYFREIFRDAVLLGMATWLTVWPRSHWSLDAVARPHLHTVYEVFLDDEDDVAADVDEIHDDQHEEPAR